MTSATTSEAAAAATESVPRFTVVLSRRPAQTGRWTHTQTTLAAVLPCAPDRNGAEALRQGANLFAFHGLRLAMHRDLAESYWANVSGDNPRLFVVCRADDGDDEVRPVLLTASGDEAAGHNETDDLTLSAPMPDAARDFVEKFVMDNHFPEPKRKRKRE